MEMYFLSFLEHNLFGLQEDIDGSGLRVCWTFAKRKEKKKRRASRRAKTNARLEKNSRSFGPGERKFGRSFGGEGVEVSGRASGSLTEVWWKFASAEVCRIRQILSHSATRGLPNPLKNFVLDKAISVTIF